MPKGMIKSFFNMTMLDRNKTGQGSVRMVWMGYIILYIIFTRPSSIRLPAISIYAA